MNQTRTWMINHLYALRCTFVDSEQKATKTKTHAVTSPLSMLCVVILLVDAYGSSSFVFFKPLGPKHEQNLLMAHRNKGSINGRPYPS